MINSQKAIDKLLKRLNENPSESVKDLMIMAYQDGYGDALDFGQKVLLDSFKKKHA